MKQRCSTKNGEHQIHSDKPFCTKCGLLMEYHSGGPNAKVSFDGKSLSSGAVARNNKKNRIYQMDKGYCQYCFKKLTYEESTIDHILPKNKGGGNGRDNLVLACQPCNQEKDDNLTFEYALILSLRHTIMKEVTKNDL